MAHISYSSRFQRIEMNHRKTVGGGREGLTVKLVTLYHDRYVLSANLTYSHNVHTSAQDIGIQLL